MKRLQRWTLGLCAGVSETLSELENHEAITHAALSDMRKSLARAKSHAERLRQHHDELLVQAKQAIEQAERWKRRAGLETEEGPAVECLRRSHAARQKSDTLHMRAQQGRQNLEEVEAEVRREEARYVELHEKHRLLQARQAAADASAACHRSLGHGEGVNEAFERWELKISEKKYQPEGLTNEAFDALSADYDSKEELEALSAEWRALRSGADDDQNQGDSRD